MRSIQIRAERDYTVSIGGGAITAVAEQISPAAKRALIIYQPTVAAVAEQIRQRLTGIEVSIFAAPDAEAAKDITVAARCWEHLGKAGFTRSDVIIGVGGGAVTDMAGFVAACWLRGVPVIQVPTTLLAMVDAAVGGKTGINTAEGKNLVGAFHSPAAVLCDPQVLRSLDQRQLCSGLGEVIKCGFIADPTILEQLAAGAAHGIAEKSGVAADHNLIDLIAKAVDVKAQAVNSDFKESGVREFLNYGHTLGHAIEQLSNYELTHGEAIAIGMVYAAEMAALMGLIDRELVRLHRDVLSNNGLPVTAPAHSWEDLQLYLRRDKKVRREGIRFVLLDGLAKPAIYLPSAEIMLEAYQRVSRL